MITFPFLHSFFSFLLHFIEMFHFSVTNQCYISLWLVSLYNYPEVIPKASPRFVNFLSVGTDQVFYQFHHLQAEALYLLLLRSVDHLSLCTAGSYVGPVSGIWGLFGLPCHLLEHIIVLSSFMMMYWYYLFIGKLLSLVGGDFVELFL